MFPLLLLLGAGALLLFREDKGGQTIQSSNLVPKAPTLPPVVIPGLKPSPPVYAVTDNQDNMFHYYLVNVYTNQWEYIGGAKAYSPESFNLLLYTSSTASLTGRKGVGCFAPDASFGITSCYYLDSPTDDATYF